MFSDKSIFLIRKNSALLSAALSIGLFYPQVLDAAEEHSYAQEIQQDVADDKVYLLESIRQKVTIPSEKTILEALLCEDGPQAVMLFQKQLREYPDPAVDKLSTSRIAAYNLALNGASAIQKSSIPLSATKPQQIVIRADTSLQSIKPQLHAHLPSGQQQPSVVTDDSTKHSTRPGSSVPHPAVLKEDTTKHFSKPQPSSPATLTATSKEQNVIDGPTTSTLQFGSFESRQNAEVLAKKTSPYASVEIVRKGQMYKVRLKTHFASKEEAAAAAKKLPVKAIVVPSI